MAKKTNKTSHVMDLLTNGEPPMAEEETVESSPGQEKKPSDTQSHAVTPAKVTVVDEGSRNDRLSQEILGKLTEELEAEARQDAEAREADGAKAPNMETKEEEETMELELTAENAEPTLAGGSPETVAEDSGHPGDMEPQGLEDEAPQASAPDAPPASEAAAKPDEQPSAGKSANKAAKAAESEEEEHPIIPASQINNRFRNKEYRFVNVMEQILLRQNLEATLKQYDVCNCPRCMSDVCALTLTGLPSKYVVTSKDSISPLISYYENRYKIPVLTALMKACTTVRKNPRHKAGRVQWD